MIYKFPEKRIFFWEILGIPEFFFPGREIGHSSFYSASSITKKGHVFHVFAYLFLKATKNLTLSFKVGKF